MGLRGKKPMPKEQALLRNRATTLKRMSESGQTLDVVSEEVLPLASEQMPVEFHDEVPPQVFWDRVVKPMYASGVFRVSDEMSLWLLCENLSRISAMRGVEPTVEDDDGNRTINPEWKVYRELVESSNRMLRECGMTPAARSRIRVNETTAVLNASMVKSPFDRRD